MYYPPQVRELIMMKGFCFVNLFSVEDAVRVKQVLQGQELNGSR